MIKKKTVKWARKPPDSVSIPSTGEKNGVHQPGPKNAETGTCEPPREVSGRPAAVVGDSAVTGQGDRGSDGGGHGNVGPGREGAKPGTGPGGSPAGETGGSLEPEACASCGCPWQWQDSYRRSTDPWRCLICDPPPSEAMIARYRDGRVSLEEREFRGKHECYTLVDSAGQAWEVVRRRGSASQACPKGESLERWVSTLRTRLLCEWD